MKKCLAMMVVVSAMTARPANIASVSSGMLEPALREFIFAMPDYAQWRKLMGAEEGDATKAMIAFGKAAKTDDKGNFSVDSQAMQKMKVRMALERDILAAERKELIRLIEGMKLKYEIVLDSDYEKAVLLGQPGAADITAQVHEEMRRRLATLSPGVKLPGLVSGRRLPESQVATSSRSPTVQERNTKGIESPPTTKEQK